MKVIETRITESKVFLRLADDTDPKKATQWIDCCFDKAQLVRLSGTPVESIEGFEPPVIRKVVLETAQAVIDAEISRL